MRRPQFMKRLALAAALIIGVVAVVHTQVTRSATELRSQLRARYDIVALQRGVALVPREARAGIRMIAIVDGVVSVDGETLTGRQLADKVGADAPLILQVSYLDATAQRELAVTGAPGEPAPSVPPATTPPPASAPSADIARAQARDGDVVRMGGNVTIGRDERINGDVVLIGGSADIDGEVTGDVTVVVGSLTLGPNALIRGDVSAIAGSFTRDPGARVLGKVTDVGAGARIQSRRSRMTPGMFGAFWSSTGSLVATILRITLLILLALAAVALGHAYVERIGTRAVASPLRAGLVGLLAEILFVPILVITVFVLAVSIIGIPLLAVVPFGIVLVMALMFVGFVGLAHEIGRMLTERFGWSSGSAYAKVSIGIVAIAALTLIARLIALPGGFIVGMPFSIAGYLIEYVAWTIGFGATILAIIEAQHRTRPAVPAPQPPPLPSEA